MAYVYDFNLDQLYYINIYKLVICKKKSVIFTDTFSLRILIRKYMQVKGL